MQKQLLHQVCNVRKVSKFLLTLGTFYFMNFSLTLASTTVPGGNISGHWTLAGSPYNIMGNVTIPSGATLTIDPGVSVVFQTSNDLRMMVNGCILAVGTPSQYIYFTAADQGSGFGGFRFDSLASTNDSSKFIYCNIQYGMDNPCPFCSGGAFYFSSWSKAVISHSTIANCQANNGYGGAIFCSASSPVITYDSLYNNSTQNYGGAIYIQNDTGEIISYNVISNNTSSSGGGAIFMNQPIKAVINYNNISFNTATTEAGGIGCNGGTFSSMNNNAIYFNTVSNGSAGGGIYLYSVNITSLNHNTITYNSLPNAYGGGGGGIWAEGCVFNSIDYDNISYNSLGADSYGGGIELYQCDVSSFSYDTISNNNVGTNGSGGGIYVYSSFSESINTTVSNTSITNNTADLTDGQGGGFYCQSANPTFLNVTMSGNNAYQGGALFFYQAKPSLYNSILWGDSAVTDTGGNEMYQYDPSCVISFYYCDVYGDSNAFGIPTGVKYTGTYKNNIHSDPKFDSTSGGVGYMNDGMLVNWGIKNTSPCFNTGDPSYLPGYPALDLAGNTRVTVCRIDMGAFENQYAQPLKLTVSTVNTVCGALATGEAAVQVVGGSTPFTYSWSGGQTTDTIKAQKAGSYTVTVKEGSGCTDKITATIIANTSMTATFSQTPPLCNGGSDGKASAMVSNGAKPYTYLWSPSGETSDTATGLSGITYTCTIMDSNGCQITPTVTISQPAAITVTNSWTDASCSNNDGIAGVTPSGGTPPYTYLWSTGSTNTNATGLAAGTYSVTVTDKNLCTLTDTLDIQLNSSSSEKAAQICIVSVDTGSKFNIIVWNKTGLARIDSFRIYFYNSSNQWQLIGAQPYAAPAYFADMTGINNPNSNTVRYSLTAVDSCGNEEPIGSSPWQNTCHINQSPPGTFTWAGTGYLKQGVSQPVFTYYLLRDSISNNHWVVVDSVSGTQNTMSDAVFQANPGNYPLARWRVSMVLSDSVNTGCKLPDEGPVHGVNNTTTRSNTQHNSIFTSVSALISAANSISVYPNPTNGKFTVQWSVVSGLSSVEVYNVLGEKVASFNSSKGGEFYSLPSGEEGWAIDLSNQPSGIYFVKVLTDKSVQVAKIIKE